MQPNHLLIVEDEEDIREILQGFFESEGMVVSTAANGYEALRFLKSAPRNPDVILLDLMMPVMSGPEFLKSIQSVQNFLTIPIVIMSADNQTAQKAKSLGQERFIRKPLDLSQLLGLLQGAHT
jgi:CheY-like chemotaxis protein